MPQGNVFDISLNYRSLTRLLEISSRVLDYVWSGCGTSFGPNKFVKILLTGFSAHMVLHRSLTCRGRLECGSKMPSYQYSMMTSSNESFFRVTDPLCGEFTGDRWIPRTKGQLCGCFFDVCPHKLLNKQPVIWNYMTFIWRHRNDKSIAKTRRAYHWSPRSRDLIVYPYHTACILGNTKDFHR